MLSKILKRGFKTLFLLGMAVLFQFATSQAAEAATRTWDGGGGDENWSTCANWSLDTCPTTADVATFDATSTKNATIDAGFTTGLTTFNMNAGYTGIITQARSLTVSGNTTMAAGTFNGSTDNLTFTGTFTLSGGTFNGGNQTVQDTGTFTISSGTYTASSGTTTFNGAFTHTAGGTFTHNSGTVIFTGAATTTNVITTESFNNLTLNKNNAVVMTVSSGDTLVVNGTLTLSNGGFTTGTVNAKSSISINSAWDGGGGTLLIDGTNTVTSSLVGGGAALASTVTLNNVNYTLNGSGAGTLTLSAFNLQAGTYDSTGYSSTFSGAFSQSGGTFTGGSGTITHTGAFTESAGTYTATSGTTSFAAGFTHTAGGTFSHSNGTVIFTGAAATVNVATSETFYDLTLSKNANAALTITSGDTLICAHTLTLTEGDFNTGTIEMQGTLSHATTYDGGSGILSITGSDVKTINFSIGNLPGINLSDANATLNAASPLTIEGSYTQSAGTFNGDASTTLTTSGAFTLSGGTYNCTSGTQVFGANFTHTAGGTFNCTSGTVKATGTADVTWDVATTESFNHFTVEMTTAIYFSVATGDTLVINGDLTENDGSMGTGAGTLDVKGNFSQGAGWDGSTGNVVSGDYVGTNISFTGSGVQTITLNATINKTPSIGFTINNANASLAFSGSGSVSFKEFALLAGTANFGATPVLFNDNVTISGGTFTASSATTNINGTFTHTAGGVFNHNGGTVTFGSGTAGETIDVASSETFNNLGFSADTAGVTMAIASGDTLIALGNLTLTEGAFTGGTVDVSGNVTVASTYDSGTTTLQFSGTADQSFDLTGATALFDGDVIINKPTSGTVTLLSAFTANLAGQDFTLTAGTFNPANFAVAVSGNYSQEAGTYGTSTAALDINGSFTLSGGTFNAPSSANMNVGGAWTHTAGGTFTHNSGTVIFDTTGSVSIDVATSETFYSLTKNTAVTKTITAGDTLIVTGTLTLTDGTFNTGTLEAQGNVSIASTWDTGTVALVFSGTADQSFTITTTAGLFDGDITINKPVSGTVTMLTAVTLNAASQDLAITAGTFYTNGFTLISNGSGGSTTIGASGVLQVKGSETLTITPVYTSGATVKYVGDGDGAADTFTLKDFGATDFDNLIIATTDAADIVQVALASGKVITGALTISSGTLDANTNTISTTGTVTVSGGTYSASTNTQTMGALTVSGGTFTGSTGTADVNGNLLITSGTLTAPSALGSLTVQGNFTNSTGTFTHNSGTVTLDANANHTITGSVTWNSLTLQDTSDNATDVTLTVEAGSTQTINGALTLDGLDDSDRLNIISSSSPTQFSIDFQSAGTFSGDYLDITDSVVVDNSVPLSTPIEPSNSNNGGNTTNWFGSGAVGVTVSAISGNTTEAGGTATYTVVLDTLPTGNVEIDSVTDDATEGAVTTGATLTFTTANWSTPQTVTVTGANDDVDDGDIGYNIVVTVDAGNTADTDYDAINPNDVAVTNTDNDAVGFSIVESGGTTAVTEGGATDSFTVVLTAQPATDVVLDVTSGDTSSATVDSASITFTNGNWSTPQTITVDAPEDGDTVSETPTITVAVNDAGSDDTFDALANQTVNVTVTDNDTAGVTVSAISGNTTEAGGTATYTVVLDTLPTGNVEIDSVTDDATEGAVTTGGTLTFTTANWSTPQTVTVTGANDDVDDGDIGYNIVVTVDAGNTADAAYDAINPSDVAVTNTDNDAVGFSVVESGGTTAVTEGGATDSFTVVLTAQPATDVVLDVTSGDTSSATVDSASITFTNGNWSTPQTITVTAPEDGDTVSETPTITVAVNDAGSDDTFDALANQTVNVAVTDNDTAGVTVSAISGNTTEAGGTATYTIVLNSQPTNDVTVGISSNNTSEGTVSPASVTFTTGNWSTPQTVTVTGVNDDVDDGDIAYSIITAAATSSDTNYNGLNASDVSVTNTDDDTTGFTVSAISGNTTEAGGTATYTIVLNSQPTNDVTVGISSNNTSEGTVSPASVTFTSGNWATPQTVTVTGVNDNVDDGDIAYSIVNAAATSSDTNYNALNPNDVSVTNTDNDTASITVSAISGDTTEAGGTATFTIVLTTQPTNDVVIGISSSDLTEGTVSAASLTFTSANWNTPQTITVTGVDDTIVDGDISYSIVTAAATSSDTNYNGMNPSNPSLSNVDNDTSGITVSAISGNTTEGGGTATFTIVLDTQPSNDVTIGLSSNDLTEGTVSPASVTFTSGNWSTPQTVTVTGVNDDVDDGDIAYSIVTAAATSSDLNYNGINAGDVSVTNTDNDTAGFTVSAISGNTTEAGATATYTIVLNTQPTNNVSVGITSDDTTEGTVSPSSVTFTTVNWSTPQTVTVTGVNDDVDDGDIGFSIVNAAATSSDTNYNGLNPNDVSVTNTDNDTAGFTVSAISGDTTEAGGTATFTIVLNTQPTNNVSIGLTSNDTTEGTVSPASVTFTTGNWSTPQTVTVTGVDDLLIDGDIAYSIVTAAATSSDTNYNAMNAADVSVTNTDNDAAASVTVSAVSGNTTEAGGTATFTIVLDYAPTNDVSIGLSSNDLTEGTVSPASVTFTTGNWSTPQTVTITGVNDDVDDGDIAYSIITAAATSSDTNYSGYNAADASVTNTDNDTAGITVTESSASTDVTEGGATDTYSVVLNTQPTASVVVSFTGSQVTTSAASFTFTTANWSTPQTLTVTATNDAVAEGTHTGTVSHTVTSSDPNYNNFALGSVTAHITDNDTAGFSVSAISGTVSEAGSTATYTVMLTSQPTADVTIGVTSNDTSEGTVSPASLTFTSGNWNSPQTVTVTGANDFIVDGTVAFSIINAAATSADSNYNTLNPSDVSVSCTDNDTAGFSVSAISGNTTETGTTATYTINLTSQPTADVSIGVTSNDLTEGTVSPASLTFTSADWNTPQTVTVTGVDDGIADGTVAFSIINAAATSADSSYNALNPADVSVSNVDNDSAAVLVTQSGGTTAATEGGATDSYTVVLSTEPTNDVTVSFTADAQVSLSSSSFVFTNLNWSTPQTLTVTAVNDAIAEGTHTGTITHLVSSSDLNYNGFSLSPVSVSITDNDTAGITLTESGASTDVTEGGATDSYTVVLTSQPTNDVTITFTPNAQVTLSVSTFTFTALNWSTPQTLTVTAANDAVAEGIHSGTITHSVTSADTNYNNFALSAVTAHITDNDTAGFSVGTISGTLAESGTTATYTVSLTSQPTADVSTTITSSDTTEGTVSPSFLTFTSLNWSTPQTVTVTGIDDLTVDGTSSFTILNAAATSSDGSYNGLDPADVSVSTTDNDTITINLTQSEGSTNVTEAGTTDSYTLVLTAQPTDDVLITLTPDAQITLSASTLTFTSLNWNTPQTITITAVNDTTAESNHTGTITHLVSSLDTNYNNFALSSVTVNITDNDTASGGGGGGGGGGTSTKNHSKEKDTVKEIQDELGSNIPEHWADGYIKNTLEESFIIEVAVAQQSFLDILSSFFIQPNSTTDRSSALRFLLVQSGVDISTITANVNRLSFTDVDPSREDFGPVTFAAQAGLINGYPDGTFQPDRIINRAEALKLVFSFYKQEIPRNLYGEDLLAHYELTSNPFKDVDLDAWYAPYVIAAYHYGIVVGYPDGEFKPGREVSNAEFLKIAILGKDVTQAIDLASVLE